MGFRYDGTFVPNTSGGMTAPMNGKKIAFLGDSLTQQSVGYDNAGFMYEHFHKITPNGVNPLTGWGRIIVENHSMTGIEHGVGMQMWFCPDDRPNGGVTAVKRLVATDFNPDYIVLEYGTNDLGKNQLGNTSDEASDNATTSYPAMRYCVETLQATYPSAKILVIGTMRRKFGAYQPRQDEYIANTKKVLSDYGVKYLDMQADSGICYEMMNTDGIHLATAKSGGGYNNDCEAVRRYARAIESALLNM